MLQLVRGGTEQKTIATLCHLLSLKYPGDRVATVKVHKFYFWTAYVLCKYIYVLTHLLFHEVFSERFSKRFSERFLTLNQKYCDNEKWMINVIPKSNFVVLNCDDSIRQASKYVLGQGTIWHYIVYIILHCHCGLKLYFGKQLAIAGFVFVSEAIFDSSYYDHEKLVICL